MSRKPKRHVFLDMRMTLSGETDRKVGIAITADHVQRLNALNTPETTLWLVCAPTWSGPGVIRIDGSEGSAAMRSALIWSGCKLQISHKTLKRSWWQPYPRGRTVSKDELEAIKYHLTRYRKPPVWCFIRATTQFPLPVTSLGVIDVNHRVGIQDADILKADAIMRDQIT